MLRFLRFRTKKAAAAHARALDASEGLPRCDSGKWGDPDVSQGASCRAPCPCEDRHAPDLSCPYVTHSASDVVELAGGGYAVEVTGAHERAKIDTSKAVALSEDDDPKRVEGLARR